MLSFTMNVAWPELLAIQITVPELSSFNLTQMIVMLMHSKKREYLSSLSSKTGRIST